MNLPTKFTPIACKAHGEWQWREMLDAVVSIDAAHAMQADGKLVMAQRREVDCTELVVKASKRMRP